MLVFSYKARDTATNKIVNSTIKADSVNAASKLLMSQNLVPLSIEPEAKGKGVLSSLQNRVTTKDRIVFIRQLATMINAGLPLSQSLRTVQDQTQNKKLKLIIQNTTSSVEGGSSLSKAFEKEEIFGDLFVALIAAGETSGTLDQALERTANQQEKDADLRSKIAGALIYPALVLAVVIGVVIFMLLAVMPQVEALYSGMGRELPLLSAIMVGVGRFIINFWYIIVIVIIAAAFGLRSYIKTEDGRRKFDTFKLNAPLFGTLFRKMYMARFMRTGETLLSSGVPMLEALRISSRSVGNVVIEKSILNAAEKVKSGKALSLSLKNEEYILPLTHQMIGIGEQSGQIDNMMGKAASYYENEVDATIKTISTTIEPIMMVLLAIVAGFMVGAILLPIYGLASGPSL